MEFSCIRFCDVMDDIDLACLDAEKRFLPYLDSCSLIALHYNAFDGDAYCYRWSDHRGELYFQCCSSDDTYRMAYSKSKVSKDPEDFETNEAFLDDADPDWKSLSDVEIYLTEDGQLLLPCTDEHKDVYIGFVFESVMADLLASLFEERICQPFIVSTKRQDAFSGTNIPPSSPTAPVAQTQTTTQKEGKTMKNNLFDFTMHQIDDDNIASTLLGIAVNTGDSWRVYDKKKKEITDLGDVQLGNFPLWVIPALKLTAGDIIIDKGKYYCVTSKNERIQTVDIATGRAHSIVPVKNILGFSVYQKIIAITDALGVDADMNGLADDKTMLLMAMMTGGQSDSNNAMQNLMPLLLFGDKFGSNTGIDDKTMVLMAMMGMNGTSGNDQQGLMQFLVMKQLLGDGKSDSKDK